MIQFCVCRLQQSEAPFCGSAVWQGNNFILPPEPISSAGIECGVTAASFSQELGHLHELVEKKRNWVIQKYSQYCQLQQWKWFKLRRSIPGKWSVKIIPVLPSKYHSKDRHKKHLFSLERN